MWQDPGGRCGVRKVWKQLHREGVPIAKFTVRCLMRQMSLYGVTRGRRFSTAIADPGARRPADLVDRQFTADRPNQLWISDIRRHEAPWNRAAVKGHRCWPVTSG